MILTCIKIAGRLKYFSHKWETFISDKNILDTGCTIEFIETQSTARETKLSLKESEILDIELETLLQKGLTEHTEHSGGQINSFPKIKTLRFFYNNLNMKSLDEIVKYIHFKMESLHSAIKLTHWCYGSCRPNWHIIPRTCLRGFKNLISYLIQIYLHLDSIIRWLFTKNYNSWRLDHAAVCIDAFICALSS